MGSYQQFKYKKHFIRKNVFMRKHMFLNITVVVALMLQVVRQIITRRLTIQLLRTKIYQ